MRSHKLQRIALFLSFVFIGVYSWLKIFRAPDPQAEDGEPEGELDPDLPFARPGDVLLFNRARGMNRLITWFTRSPFYHVGIALGDNRVVEARPRGVVIRDLTGPDGDKRFQIIPAENVGGREVAEKAMRWALSHVGEGYDPFNVLSIILDRTFAWCKLNLSLPHHWACGEFVAFAFREAGHDLFPHSNPVNIVPADYEKFLPALQPRFQSRG